MKILFLFFFILYISKLTAKSEDIIDIKSLCDETRDDVINLENKRKAAKNEKASEQEYNVILDKMAKRAKIYHYLECSRFDVPEDIK